MADGTISSDQYGQVLSTATPNNIDIITLFKSDFNGIRVWFKRQTGGAGSLFAKIVEVRPDGSTQGSSLAMTPNITGANQWGSLLLYPGITPAAGSPDQNPTMVSTVLPPEFKIQLNTNGGGGSAGTVQVYYQMLG